MEWNAFSVKTRAMPGQLSLGYGMERFQRKSSADKSGRPIDDCAGLAENGWLVIAGVVQNGVVVLQDGASVPEGTQVTVVVRAGAPAAKLSEAEHRRIVQVVEGIAALPDENPSDTFSGADHDRVLYGDP